MLSLDMSTNIQTCLEIIVNIWSGPGSDAFMALVDPYSVACESSLAPRPYGVIPEVLLRNGLH